MIAMAKSLKMNIIAEGVQTVEQATFLQENGCDWIQGYLISPPVPENELIWLLEENINLPLASAA